MQSPALARGALALSNEDIDEEVKLFSDERESGWKLR
jgi:hypothetical protein